MTAARPKPPGPFAAFEWMLALRYLRARRKEGSVSVIAAFSVIGIALGYSDADKCAAWLTGNGQEATTEAIKQRQFVLLCFGQAGVMLDAFTQHSEGLLNDEQFNSVRVAYRDWLQAPGFRQFLLSYRTVASPGAPKFSTFLDGLMADPPQQTGV